MNRRLRACEEVADTPVEPEAPPGRDSGCRGPATYRPDARAREAADAHDELRSEPLVGGKPSPWLTVAEKTNRAVVALSLRLRLSPQARAPNTPTKREAAPSAYDVMRLADENEGS